MTLSLPQGGNATLAQVDPTAQTVFIGLNWELPATTPQVQIDASLFLLNASGVVRDNRDYRLRHCVGLGTAALLKPNNDKVCVMPEEKGRNE